MIEATVLLQNNHIDATVILNPVKEQEYANKSKKNQLELESDSSQDI